MQKVTKKWPKRQFFENPFLSQSSAILSPIELKMVKFNFPGKFEPVRTNFSSKKFKTKNLRTKIFLVFEKFWLFLKIFSVVRLQKKIVTSPRKKNFRKKNFFFDFCDYQVFFSKSRIFQNFSNFPKWCIRGNLGQFFVFLHYFGVKN